jgi:hypothetical protein
MWFMALRSPLPLAGLKEEYICRQEDSYGYPKLGDLWTPGYFQLDLEARREITVAEFIIWR